MKTQSAHAHEDRLLDFAYDELPLPEARQVEQHLQGCSRCSEQLQGIRGVRHAMSRLSREPAPDAGMESLMAYAQQSARRSAAGAQPAPRWWRRLLTPALGVAAMSIFGLVVLQVDRQVNLSPSLQQKAPPAPEPSSRRDSREEGVAAPVVAAAAPAELAAREEQAEPSAEKASAPRPSPVKVAPSKSTRAYDQANWSNAGVGSGGGFPEKKKSVQERDTLGDDEDGLLAQGPSTPSLAKDKGDAAPGRSQRTPASRPASVGYASQSLKEEEAFAQKPSGSVSGVTRSARASDERASASETLAADASPVASTGSAPQATASPPPPPPAPAQYAQADDVAQNQEQEARRPEAPKSQMPMRRSLSAGEILQQADVAHRSGNRAEEVVFLRAALTSGVQGTRRVDVLSRLCEAEFALNNRRNAIEVCKQVIAVAPGSSEARSAQRLLDSAQAPAD